jgi:Bcr/CflA subfamily drug resistance transporter
MTDNKQLIPYLMIIAISVTLIATDLYLPAMPMMAEYFQTSDNYIQHSISAFQFGLIFSALVYGPLSDSFGRRRTLLFGYGLYVLGSILLLFSTDVDFLLAMRLLQGCGAGVSAALSPAIIRDCFNERESSKIIAQMSVAIIMAPALAPVAGGYLTAFFGWQACFVCLAILAGLSFALFLKYFPETHPEESRSRLHPTKILDGYREVFSNKSFVYYVLAHSLPSCGIWCYITVMPFAYIKYMGVETQHFGYYAFAQITAISLTSIYVGKIIAGKGPTKTMAMGLKLFLAGSATMLFAILSMPDSPALATACVIPYFLGVPFIFPSSMAKAMSMAGASRGAGASCVATGRQICAFIGSFTAAVLPDSSLFPAIIFMIIVAAAVALTMYLARKNDPTTAQEQMA